MSVAEAAGRRVRAFLVEVGLVHVPWGVVGIFTVLTALLFWPYALHPATTVSDPGDPLLVIWIMEWVQRALVHSPSELFNAPMFYPFHDTLAYSEPLIPEALLALPLRALGFGAVFAYNFVFLGGIVLAGVLTTLLFEKLTVDRLASLVGAVVATFPAARLSHLAHLQVQFTAFWPLVLILIHRLVERPDARRVLVLAAALGAAPLASLYYGAYMALLLPPFAFVLWATTPGRSWKVLGALGLAALGAGVMLWPFARVYARALGHLGQTRHVGRWVEPSHYVTLPPFADLGRWIPGHVVRDTASQWVGGGAALLLPVSAVGIGVVAARRWRGASSGHHALPRWVHVSLPYVVLGCLAIVLSLPPELQWFGHKLGHNPFAGIAKWPGVRELRDIGRTAFAVAMAGGGLVAVGLSELRRGRERLARVLRRVTVLTTIVPFFSTSLPVYRPPPFERLAPVYQWLARRPDPMIVYEVPEPPFDAPLDFLWAAVHHKKRLVHGYSGYFPLTDLALRGESTNAHRPDFWRALGVLGATHVIVHADRLAALPGGISTLVKLEDIARPWRIATLRGAQVYQVPPAAAVQARPEGLIRQTPAFTTGGLVARPAGACADIGPGLPPLVAYVPEAATIAGLGFVAEGRVGDLDDDLQVERSRDLRAWWPAPHEPLLSTSLADYVRGPTPVLWTRAALTPDMGPFVRVATRRGRARLCKLSIDFPSHQLVHPLASRVLRVESSDTDGVPPSFAADGDPTTRWHSPPAQSGREWLSIDLGASREVVGVAVELGNAPAEYGRELALDCGDTPQVLEPGSPVDGRAALFERPRAVQILPLPSPRRCRVLRIRQTGQAPGVGWSVADVQVYEQHELPMRLDVTSENVVCMGCWGIEHGGGASFVWTTAAVDLVVSGLAAGRAYRVTLGIADTGAVSRAAFHADNGPADDVPMQKGPVTWPRSLTASDDGTLRWSVRVRTWRPKDRVPGSSDDRELGVAIADILIEEALPRERGLN